MGWIGEGSEILSHPYYCYKAAELLKPLGILALIVPCSFLADDFSDKAMIREMQERFSFLGQVGLPDNAFAGLGVESFPTKLQLWQKKCGVKGWTACRYTTGLAKVLPDGFDPAAEAQSIYEQMLMLPRADLEQNKSHVLLELARESNASKAFALWDAENEEYIRLNDIQRRDINVMLQKQYGMLQWEQGSGKTLAGITMGLYRMERQGTHSTWVVSSAISIRNNWGVALPE